MKTSVSLIAGCFLALFGTTLSAQESPEMPGLEKEHQWLQKFVGKWTVVSKATMGPDQPSMEGKGTMSTRSVGDRWIVNEMTAEFNGMQVVGLQTIGYDPAAKKYVGSWVDSSSDFMWKYEGTVDESGTKIILEADGPDMLNAGKVSKYRDAYEFKSADHIIATSSMQNDDGNWVTFMTGEMTRVKKSEK